MSDELAAIEERPLTVADVRAQVNLIQEVMRTIMQDGQHYGKILGCGNKPTLLKPGAEKILVTFGLAVDPEVTDLSHDDIIRYRVKCRLITRNGRFVGAGLGECSSEEDKYKWRSAVSDAEYNATIETHKRIKYTRDNQIKQVRTNPFDLANTILKMAKKRAQIDATLTVTAASDIFTQDVEDMPEELLNKTDNRGHQQQNPLAQKTQTKSDGSIAVEGYIMETSEKSGEKNGKKWTLHGVNDGINWYNTFDKELSVLAKDAKERGDKVKITYKQGPKSKDLVSIESIPTEADNAPDAGEVFD